MVHRRAHLLRNTLFHAAYRLATAAIIGAGSIEEQAIWTVEPATLQVDSERGEGLLSKHVVDDKPLSAVVAALVERNELYRSVKYWSESLGIDRSKAPIGLLKSRKVLGELRSRVGEKQSLITQGNTGY